MMNAVKSIFVIFIFTYCVTFGQHTNPNIFVALTDDQGWADIGYSEPIAYTPTLDSDAGDCFTFSHRYVAPENNPTKDLLQSDRDHNSLSSYAHSASNNPVFPFSVSTDISNEDKYESHVSSNWIPNSSNDFFTSDCAQIDLFPMDRQLYARDTLTNKAAIPISGQVNNLGDSVSLVITKDNQPYLQMGVKPTANGLFVFLPQIEAELANYTIELYVITESFGQQLCVYAQDVLAGDAFVITGQSNAEASMVAGSGTVDNSAFIRVFALGTDSESILLSSLRWFYGNADGNNNVPGNVGQWGMHMAKNIVDHKQIPVAIFNGAKGGKEIGYFEKNDLNPQDLSTNYGRLLYRLEMAKLKNKIRALFWVQGESDILQNTSIADYKQRFHALHDDWLGDLSTLEKTYITQIRDGCGALPTRTVIIQEALRQLAIEIPDASIMSMKGMQHHTDNCHYPYENGYKELGRRYYNLVSRDLYSENVPFATAPQILSARFLSPTEIKITAVEGDNLFWQNQAHDFFTLERSSATVLSGTTIANEIILQLDGCGLNATGITLLDEVMTTGPNVVNQDGVGMLSFYNVPMQRPFDGYSGDVLLDADHNRVCDSVESDCLLLISDNFESENGIWQSGGRDAERVLDPNSPQGNYSMRIRDNSRELSTITSSIFDLSAISTLRVGFIFRAVYMGINEHFKLEISNDGGATFTTIKRWVVDIDFVNNTKSYASVEIASSLLSSTAVLRFQSVGTINADQVLLDNIIVQTCESCVDFIIELDKVDIVNSSSANISIQSNGAVRSDNQIDYMSGLSIELREAFEVELGAVFHGFITSCN